MGNYCQSKTSENGEAQVYRRRIQRGDMAGIGSAP